MKQETSKHTPSEKFYGEEDYISEDPGQDIADLLDEIKELKNKNAILVMACNAHDGMVEALKGIIEIGKRDLSNPKYDSYFEAAKQAISKAEGKP